MEPILGVCGNLEQLGDGSPSLKLQTNRPLVFVRDPLPDHDQDEIWTWMDEALKRWGKVCNFIGTRIHDLTQVRADQYVLLITAADLGGGGVLADQMLPYSGGRMLRMRLNTRIRWNRTDGAMAGGTIDPVRVVTHELGHAMGHQHFPVGAPAELMEPTVSNTIITPQPTEARVSAAWFGPPEQDVPPDDTWEFRVRIKGKTATIIQ